MVRIISLGNMRKSLDTYDIIPEAMRAYISNYGFHFSKHAYEYAASLMEKKNPQTGRMEKVKAYTKDEVDAMIAKYGIQVKNRVLYDYVYVATMAKADYYGSSISDEAHLVLFIKDYVDDEDASDETTFRRWLATMIGNGEPIEWEDIL